MDDSTGDTIYPDWVVKPRSRRRTGNDVALICENGHIVNDTCMRNPTKNAPFCPKCGLATARDCRNCRTAIRGRLYSVHSCSLDQAPSFCEKCGEPFPWTKKNIKSLKETLDLISELDDRDILKASISDLLSETPRTEVAAYRWKLSIGKLPGHAKCLLWSILQTVVSEAIKKKYFGDAP